MFSSPTILLAHATLFTISTLSTPTTTTFINNSKITVQKALVKTPAGELPMSLFVGRIIGILILVLLGGLFAGLTLGLMSLDETNLHILANSGDIKQKKYANRIYPIRKNGHLLLTTLLLSNTLVNETLPILIDGIAGGSIAAVLISTCLILVFGEIIPQSVCARHGLKIGAFFAWPVRILIFLMYIVAFPIAKLLDYVLGENHGMTYRRSELKELVAFHQAGKGGNLSHDEVTIIKGALDLSDKSVVNIMTPLEHVFMVEIDCLLDSITLRDIMRAGNSRIPVYKRTRENIVGLLLAKSLIMVDPNASTPVRDIKLYQLPKVDLTKSIFELLNLFQEGSSHMSLVCKKVDSEETPVGIVTLEDVVEELIQEEIVDETDVYIDVSNRIKVYRKGTTTNLLHNNSRKNTINSRGSVQNILSRSSTTTKKKQKKREKKLANIVYTETNSNKGYPIIISSSSSKRNLVKSHSHSNIKSVVRFKNLPMSSNSSIRKSNFSNKRPGTLSDYKDTHKNYSTFSLPNSPKLKLNHNRTPPPLPQ